MSAFATTPAARTETAIALMNGFAARTGLTGTRPPHRYLWTDAFAVCNYLGLARATGNNDYTALALSLVEQVHHTLGRHREDDRRRGWISGLDAQDGEQHPTRGGLRIGKALPERGAREPFDERLEWERDGQYFHYLTKWMHALDQVARGTRQPRYNVWARELAETAFRAFTRQASPAEPRRMAWKMSIDLSRAQVASMGQHDPLDGYITQLQLRATAAVLPPLAGPALDEETHGYADMIRRGEWATADPLGLGGLLTDACRLQQLVQQGAVADSPLLDRLLDASLAGLQYYAHSGEQHLPAQHRLAFRELGLAIGLHAVEYLHPGNSRTRREQHRALLPYASLRDDIETFWRDPDHRQVTTWSEHRDINEVMLATSLAPAGFLVLPALTA